MALRRCAFISSKSASKWLSADASIGYVISASQKELWALEEKAKHRTLSYFKVSKGSCFLWHFAICFMSVACVNLQVCTSRCKKRHGLMVIGIAWSCQDTVIRTSYQGNCFHKKESVLLFLSKALRSSSCAREETV